MHLGKYSYEINRIIPLIKEFRMGPWQRPSLLCEHSHQTCLPNGLLLY